jgi:hypothetical protein
MSDYESVRGVVYDKPRALLRRYHDKGHEPFSQVLHAGFPFESSPTQGTRA